ncbi:MAG: alanine racemase [Candidatus Omnitrophica bacterium]|nr:alanine racemase [Candidatus Omnitrophota bacterium]
MKFYRPTLAEIDLGAIRHNLEITSHIVKAGTKILGVVKADAYGHGMQEVSKAIVDYVDYFGVASLDEAAILRSIGIKKPILVIGAILPEEIEGVLKFNVIQTVSDLDIPKRLSKLALSKNKKIKVHVKVDTGMGRLGFWHEEAVGFVKKIAKLKNIIIDGIFTHFPNAESDRVFTYNQIKNFKRLIKELWDNDIYIPVKHTANSMGLIDFKDSHMNMVRPGLMMYGIYPKESLMRNIRLRPALTLKTKITHLKSMPKGRSISYGMTYITKKPTKIATIPVGYGDGYSRNFSNKAEVLINSSRCPIAGRVCMDMCMIDVGHLKNVKVGDDVILIGSQGKEIIRAEELAGLINTIPYEVLCNIGCRVPRVYIYKCKGRE